MSAASGGVDVLVSPFESDEAEASYERWFRAKVQEALDSKAPRIPHDEVMAMIRERKEAAIRKAGHAAD
ncbi:stability determinant [Lysobacteraceae bacterium NML95-0200]|nr:stability determinant [Xanthomonadaceae bacterium NML95-0200]